MPARSVGLSEDAMNALSTLWKAMYPIFSLHNINFCMLVEEQELENGNVLTVAWFLCSPIRQSTSGVFQTKKTQNMKSLLLLT